MFTAELQQAVDLNSHKKATRQGGDGEMNWTNAESRSRAQYSSSSEWVLIVQSEVG
jgi:hypothetical protein